MADHPVPYVLRTPTSESARATRIAEFVRERRGWITQLLPQGSSARNASRWCLGDQPAASCLYRAELAGAQQVMDEFPGDAQQFSGFVRAVGEPGHAGQRE